MMEQDSLFLFKNWFKSLILGKKHKEHIKKRMLFYSSFVFNNELCFDIGANIGNRVRPLLNIGAKIIAVEPQQKCIKVLDYKFGRKIEIIPKGVGAKESVKDFYIANEHTSSSFSKKWIDSVKKDRFKKYNWNKIVKMEITTLDKLIEKYGLPVFIKIDVEGYELEVLKGLTKPIKMISFEYMIPEQIDQIMQCVEQIELNDSNIECNYSIGESMMFEHENWVTVKQLRTIVGTTEFINTLFGDIYVRLRNN